MRDMKLYLAAADDNDANKSTCAYGTADLNEDDNSTYLELEVLQAAEKLGEGEFLFTH